jgi:hypothetical protein
MYVFSEICANSRLLMTIGALLVISAGYAFGVFIQPKYLLAPADGRVVTLRTAAKGISVPAPCIASENGTSLKGGLKPNAADEKPKVALTLIFRG